MEKKQWKYQVDYIKPLDGIRALSILIVAWYHIWLLSWLQPIKEVSWLKWMNASQINLDWIVRTGYEMVPMMLLISGFCLFLPYAKSMVLGSEEPKIGLFYKKRAARILPSYYFAIIVAFIVALTAGKFVTSSQMWNDLIPHLFFVHTYNETAYAGTNLNGVLWTLAIEVQFYIIFPFVAKLFRRWTVQTYIGMVAISWIFDNWIIVPKIASDRTHLWINQLPTYLGTYANGMLLALVTVQLAHMFNSFLENRTEEQRMQDKKIIGLFFTAVMGVCLYLYYMLMKNLTGTDRPDLWEINNRYELTMVYSLFILGSVFALPFVQNLLGNRVMKFLSGISFQLYIWHQFLSGLLKDHHIPYWEGDTAPNLLGDRVWMWKYFLCCWGVSFAAAIIGTYCIERPCSKWIMKWKRKQKA